MIATRKFLGRCVEFHPSRQGWIIRIAGMFAQRETSMFRKNKPPAAIPAGRVQAIAEQSAPTDYGDDVTRDGRAARTTVFKQAMLMLPHGEKVPVVIKNMSSTGLRVEFFQNRQLGDRVLVTEASVPLRFWADVVWESDGAGGLRLKKESAGKSGDA
jgi:hypothetical protein